MAVPYDYYRIFYYVAQHKSFTKAAEALGNNQPNITRCMNNLEQDLGCKLFVRTNHGVSLTPEGQRLYNRAAVAFEQLRLGESELRADCSLRTGSISIAASEAALHLTLLDRLDAFHRRNPGIHLRITNDSTPRAMEEAVEIANYFLPRGKTIVTTKGKIKQASNTYKTLREPLDTDIPIAVLVNSGTASASEILAGALQDYDRAVIVGNRTFGKGLVQVPRTLPYGGTMKVTTSKYYIPSGRCVQAIDYKHRNPDGSVGRIPDSLTTVFHTAVGREVRDGGGVTPDVAVEQEKLPNILFYLVNDNLIFNYATQYCLKHPTIASPENFEVTDADYAEFKEMVKKADFKYDQQSEKILKNLKEMAEFEGYMKDASEEFKALEQKLSHNLDRDLDYFAKDIKNMIAQDIIKRYYFQRGGIIQQLKDDDDLNEAVKVLGNSEEYKKMLSVPETTVIKEKGKETSLVNFNSYRKSSLMIFDYVV